ncbi:ATP12 family protein [Gluconobacter wancherniae]|uniref:ATP12 family protein n=1 Tax=Gluconobacter wancherniae TaxID=1307955 RepID=UPI001B8BC19E|nr:ATP12 family protein [Gluconobacter wancherniae]MBS1093290.1 ATP12 chaperone protein [Gluconobacter wancherniae]
MSARKRFWSLVSVKPDEAGFTPQLDGRPIRLPQEHVLSVQSHALADAIADEWRSIAEGAAFTPEDLPLTRMAGTMIERVRPDLMAAREALFRFAVDDGLCYRAYGRDLEAHEHVFSWLNHHAVHPSVTDGLMPVEQSDAYYAAVRHLLAEQDEASLTVLGVLTQALGSLLLSLAVVSDGINEGQARSVACADEEHQLSVWGVDAELQQAIDRRAEDLRTAMNYLRLYRHV